jgi:hypothetical protein
VVTVTAGLQAGGVVGTGWCPFPHGDHTTLPALPASGHTRNTPATAPAAHAPHHIPPSRVHSHVSLSTSSCSHPASPHTHPPRAGILHHSSQQQQQQPASTLVTLEQALAPKARPPAGLAHLVRGLCGRVLTNMMEDLRREVARRQGLQDADGGPPEQQQGELGDGAGCDWGCRESC